MQASTIDTTTQYRSLRILRVTDASDDEEPGSHSLDVYLTDGHLTDVHLDGESVHPTWFKIEWKGASGEVSAKIKGLRLATRYGDAINIHSA
jgi:hypothetical protein